MVNEAAARGRVDVVHGVRLGARPELILPAAWEKGRRKRTAAAGAGFARQAEAGRALNLRSIGGSV